MINISIPPVGYSSYIWVCNSSVGSLPEMKVAACSILVYIGYQVYSLLSCKISYESRLHYAHDMIEGIQTITATWEGDVLIGASRFQWVSSLLFTSFVLARPL